MILLRFRAVLIGLLCMVATDVAAVSIVGTTGGRPSVAAGRMPTMSTMTLASGRITTGKTSLTGGSYLSQGDGCTTFGIGTCDSVQLDTLTNNKCTQKYLACLKQDAVCGSNFELCDTLKNFESKRFMCQETLAQCPPAAVQSLFGLKTTPTVQEKRQTCDGENVVTQRKFTPSLCDIKVAFSATAKEQDSLIGTEIMKGADYASRYAVKTCQAVADACIENACRNQPWKCITTESLSEAKYEELAKIVDATGGTEQATTRVRPALVKQFVNNMSWSKENMLNFLKGECKVEIGGNKSCFIYVEERMPKGNEDQDDFQMNITYDGVMTGEINRLAANQNRILEWLAQSVRGSLNRCVEFTRQCVVGACGHGSLAMCYGQAIAQNNDRAVRLQDIPYIGGQCKDQVNANQDCADILAQGDNREGVWAKVWTTESNDSLGIVTKLNLELSQLFNETALMKKRKSCVDYADACVLRQCGHEYQNCLINGPNAAQYNSSAWLARLLTGNTDGEGFSKNMALGLCLIPVKKNQDCADWFDVQYAKASGGQSGDSWNTVNNARNAWIQDKGAVGTEVCTSSRTYSKFVERIEVTEDGDVVDDMSRERVTERTAEEMHCAKVEQSIFDDLIRDAANTAHSMLERRQNVRKNQCESNNRGAPPPIGSYVWTDNPTIFNSYETKTTYTADTAYAQGYGSVSQVMDDGTTRTVTGNSSGDWWTSSQASMITTEFATLGFKVGGDPTKNLFGAFCQVRIELSTRDGVIDTCLNEVKINRITWSASGMTWACGSQINDNLLQKFNTCLNDEAQKQAEKDIKKSHMQQWTPWLTALGGAGLAALGSNTIMNSIEKNKAKKADAKVSDCEADVKKKIADCKLTIKSINEKEASLKTGKTLSDSDDKKRENCQDFIDDEAETRIEACVNKGKTTLGSGTRIGVNVVSAAVGAAVVGGVTRGLVDDALRSKREKHVAEWFEQVGSKIECKINGKVVGTYMEEIQL